MKFLYCNIRGMGN